MTQRFMIRTWPMLAKLTCSVLLFGALDNLSAQEAPKPAPAPAQAHAPVRAAPESARTSLVSLEQMSDDELGITRAFGGLIR